jgi:hypothetical protein
MAYVGRKPADAALTADDLENGIVTADKLASNSVTTAKVTDVNITTGKIADDAITNAKTEFTPGLVIKGDGSSADGKLTLNCSQNSHGVSIQGPPHSAGQSYTLTLPQSITNGYFLQTDGSGNLSFAQATETKPTVADTSQTIAPDTATDINIGGTNFSGIPKVEFIKTTGAVTTANSVSLTNSTTLAVNATLSSGSYYVRIELDDGNAARSTNAIITASTSPTWSTSAGSLGSIAGDFSGTVTTVSASSDSAITYSETTSVLTNASQANCALNSTTGVITTSDFGGSSTTPTTYTFTLTSSFGATGGGQFN